MLDMETCVPLGFRDLQGEIHRSRVFPPATKRRLIGIFTKLVDLLMLLTDVLPIAFPFEAKMEAMSGFRDNEESKILHCCKQVVIWYQAVHVEYPVFHATSEAYDQPDDLDPAKCAILTQILCTSTIGEYSLPSVLPPTVFHPY
jgi:hypothetical protein